MSDFSKDASIKGKVRVFSCVLLFVIFLLVSAAFFFSMSEIGRVSLADKLSLISENMKLRLATSLIGDESRVRQILLNLLSNAVKYTHEGFVKFRAWFETASAEGKTALLSFEISDSGIGIKTEDMPKLFEHFVRLDDERNTNVEGTGLGLSISRLLCEAMGGRINTVSEYGAGSTFTATIMQGISDERPIGAMNVKRPETNLRVAEGLLDPYKMKITGCTNGPDALRLVRDGSFDLVLMDRRNFE
jgi:hypothetical protein